MIVVTGATGTIGRELVRLLAGSGEPVRALSRSPARTEGTVEWLQVDLADRPGLEDALDGADRLYLLTGNGEDMVRLQGNAIEAAARTRVRAVVKLSALGATDRSRSVIGLWHYNVERALRESGLGWTLIRPHHFMQNFLDPLVLDPADGVVRSSAGDGVIPFVDTRDIAAVSARVLMEPDAHHEQIHTLTGPEALSYAQATEVIARIAGRELTHVPESVDEAWARRRAAGQPTWLVAAQLALAEYQRAGGATARTTDTVERITGEPARSLERFARDHAEQLRGHDTGDGGR